MPYNIERVSYLAGPFAATSDPATSARISLSSMASGMLFVDSISNATPTINWYACKSLEATTASQIFTSAGAVTTPSIVAGRAYSLPAELFGAQIVVAVLSAGTGQLTVAIKG